ATTNDEWDEDRVEERPMVGGEDHGPAPRDVFAPLDAYAHEHTHERCEDALEDPVQGASAYAASGDRTSEARQAALRYAATRLRSSPTGGMRPTSAWTSASVSVSSIWSRQALSSARPVPRWWTRRAGVRLSSRRSTASSFISSFDRLSVDVRDGGRVPFRSRRCEHELTAR